MNYAEMSMGSQGVNEVIFVLQQEKRNLESVNQTLIMKAERASDEVYLCHKQLFDKDERIKLLGESLQKA